MAPKPHTDHAASPALIGAHMSISGGLAQALYNGTSIGCTCIQLFTHSNRQWHIKPLEESEIAAFATARAETGIQEIAAHASYLINLGSPRATVYKQSVALFTQELLRCEALEIPYLIMHPGSALASIPEESMYQIAKSLHLILQEIPHRHTMVLLENMAGQGSTIGSTLEELATLKDAIKHPKRIGFCIDTCHAFAAGYPIHTADGYATFWKQCNSLLGPHSVKVIHLNDSLRAFNSHVDRHTDIGAGNLGLQTFKRIMQDRQLKAIPKILETPHTSLADDTRNLDTLRKLI